ncbi:MAG TPA: hypothetical protein VFV96_05440 [Verrucomicrobiae bacterium]|nr:hypothetical protein [Verrucomicrobiae bacterium]
MSAVCEKHNDGGYGTKGGSYLFYAMRKPEQHEWHSNKDPDYQPKLLP